MRSICSHRMDQGEFVIRSCREAQEFQFRLGQYRKRRCGGTDLLRPGYLHDLYSFAQRGDATRLFAAVYDLEITFLFMEMDICSTAGTHNLQFAPGRPHENSVPLFSDAAFAGKMDTLEHLTAFALRCRAFWDKVMGVLFLLSEPAKYDAFTSNRSRRRFFANRAAEWPDPPSHLLGFLQDPNFRALDPKPRFPDILVQVMDSVDTIRTAEAHGAGRLRKSALGTVPVEESLHATLLAHYNIGLGTMKALRRTLEELACG